MDHSYNFVCPLDLGIYYISYLWRMDSYPISNSISSNCDTATSGSASDLNDVEENNPLFSFFFPFPHFHVLFLEHIEQFCFVHELMATIFNDDLSINHEISDHSTAVRDEISN